MEDGRVARICEQMSLTLAKETDAACQAMKAELQRRQQEVIRQLIVQLQEEGPPTTHTTLGPGARLDALASGAAVDDVKLDATRDTNGNMLTQAAAAPTGAEAAKNRMEDRKLREERRARGEAEDVVLEGAHLDPAEAHAASTAVVKDPWSRPKQLLRAMASVMGVHVAGLEESKKKSGTQLKRAKSLRKTNTDIVNRLVKNPWFEGFVMCMILLSIVVIAVDVQITGLNVGYDMGFGTIQSAPRDGMPAIGETLKYCDIFFGVVFTSEMVLKIMGLRCRYFTQMFNLVDFFIVVFWLLENTNGLGLDLNPMLLRLVRLFKVMRLLKLARTVEHLESLFLLIESIKASRSVCFWATVLLGVIQTGVAIFLNQILNSYMTDPDLPIDERTKLFMYFGTFTRAMVTMLEITFGNFVPVCRVLLELSEWYSAVVIVYKLLVGFAAIRIISGIFMCETLRVANNNDQIIRLQNNRRKRHLSDTMNKLFAAADESGDGNVDLDEFLLIWGDETVKTWLAGQELVINDPRKFFYELAGEDHTISAEEMIAGVSRLKGNAKSIDLVHHIKDHKGLVDDVHAVRDTISLLSSNLMQGTRMV